MNEPIRDIYRHSCSPWPVALHAYLLSCSTHNNGCWLDSTAGHVCQQAAAQARDRTVRIVGRAVADVRLSAIQLLVWLTCTEPQIIYRRLGLAIEGQDTGPSGRGARRRSTCTSSGKRGDQDETTWVRDTPSRSCGLEARAEACQIWLWKLLVVTCTQLRTYLVFVYHHPYKGT